MKLRTIAITIGVTVLLSVTVFFLLVRAPATACRNDPFIRTQEATRDCVRKYGRSGSVEQKKQALNIIRRLTQNSNRGMCDSKRLLLTPMVGKLKRIRRDIPNPGLPSGRLADSERATLEVVNEPISESDLGKAHRIALESIRSHNVEGRKSAVIQLANLGEAGVPELSSFIGDADSSVSMLATDSYIEIVRMMENDLEAATAIKLGLLATKDESPLGKLADVFVMCSDSSVAVSAILDVVRCGAPEQASAAKMAYGFVTGDEWTDFGQAERWIDDYRKTDDLANSTLSTRMNVRLDDARGK